VILVCSYPYYPAPYLRTSTSRLRLVRQTTMGKFWTTVAVAASLWVLDWYFREDSSSSDREDDGSPPSHQIRPPPDVRVLRPPPRQYTPVVRILGELITSTYLTPTRCQRKESYFGPHRIRQYLHPFARVKMIFHFPGLVCLCVRCPVLDSS
jgi:hypothetical protein